MITHQVLGHKMRIARIKIREMGDGKEPREGTQF